MNFETGKTYYGRSVCNYESIFEITVAERTAKTIVTTEGKRYRIKPFLGNETIRLGSYSMAPIISADKVKEAV